MGLCVDDIFLAEFVGVSTSKGIDVDSLTKICNINVHKDLELAFQGRKDYFLNAISINFLQGSGVGFLEDTVHRVTGYFHLI